MRPKLQKQSALKLVGRIIPRSGGYYTRDFVLRMLRAPPTKMIRLCLADKMQFT